jgi:(R,R)-butanediol dehydrogenase / meso-butanediol dehydrogenase / diacetyl reductase
MRAGIISGLRSFELIDVPEPTPAPGQAVVEIQLCGICGSDVHAYVEGWSYAPSLCGHEWFGEVVALAADAAGAKGGVKEGDLVMGGIAPGCGRCDYCRIGRPQYCQPAFREYNGMGENPSPNGGFAPFLGIDARRLAVMPPEMSAVAGAVVEPASVAFHAVRQSGMRPGDSVAVVGAGPIGQLTAQCARIAGAGLVVVVEPDQARRDKAVSLGADVGLDGGPETRTKLRELTGGLGVDVAFDAAGVPQTLEASIDLLRRGGTACLVGATSRPAEVRTNRWMAKEIRLVTSMVFTRDEATTVGRLIVDGRMPAAAIHEGTIGLDDLGPTIEGMAEREITSLKLMVDPTR